MSSIGSEKAYFINDDGGATFYVQFNPKEMKLDESAAWKESKEFQIDKPLVEFDRGKASSLSMELIFDTTDTGEDVRERWTSKLAGFVSVTVSDTDNVHDATRPPRCTFNWGSFSFPAVIESVSTSFIMFASNGNPLRAKVAIKLKERNEEQIGTGAGPGVTLSAPVSAFGGRSNSRTESAKISAGSGQGQTAAMQDHAGVGTNATQSATGFTGVSTYTVQEGDTLSGIALFLSIEFWWIACANNIEDPMNLTPGDTLVIPPSQQVAEVFQHLPAGDNKWYWGDYDPQLNPDSDLADIFAIYDGEWDPFAEQELEDLGAETALEVGVGDQVSGDWAMSEYEGNAPDATVFERPGAVDSSFERIGREGDGAQAMAAGPGVSDYEGNAAAATEFERPDAVDGSIERIGSEGDGAQAMAAGPDATGAQGDGAQAMAAGPGVSGYDGDRPDETEFAHGESGSSDIFSVYAPPKDDEQGGAPPASAGSSSTTMERPSDPAPAASNEAARSQSSASAASSGASGAPPSAAVKVDVKKVADTVSRANRNRGSDDS